MRRRIASIAVTISCAVAIAGALLRNPRAASHSLPVPAAAKQRISTAYANLPLTFEANRGQTDSEVKFLSRVGSYNLFLTATEAVLKSSTSDVRMRLLDANPAPQVEGLDELPAKSNYFIGNDPAKWRTQVPQYRRVRYRSVYPGVDLVYYGNQRQIEHDFVVAPGADPQRIRLEVSGADKVEVDGEGELVMHAASSEMRLRKPAIYQEQAGVRREVAGGYTLLADNRVTFALGAYDTTQPLVIDPVLVYSTYLGGSGDEPLGAEVFVDDKGNAYLAGGTSSPDFATANPAQAQKGRAMNAFVAKLSADGSSLIYSTYLGGSNCFAYSVAVDSKGNAYVGGATMTPDFPVTDNVVQQTYGGGSRDGFIAKLSADGSKLIYSTYLGGSGFDIIGEVGVDDQGNATASGATGSPNFPTANAAQTQLGGGVDAFVAKLNADGSKLIFSTYLGGSASDSASWHSRDAQGNIYASGFTASANFPTTENAFQKTFGGGSRDAWLAKLTPDGKIIFVTYFGGSGTDLGGKAVADTAGNIYLTGGTNSADFPLANAFQSTPGGGMCDNPPRPCYDAYVAKFSPDGSKLLFSTYLGGSGDENCTDDCGAIALDAAGNVYVTGQTSSVDFPTVNAVQPEYGGGPWDGFVAKLSPDGSTLIYSTYLGGSGDDEAGTVAVDKAGSVYISGLTTSADFPTANAAQPAYGGGASDVFLVKLGPGPASFAVSAANLNAPLAVESISSLFGSGLAKASATGDPQSPPTSLGGISLRVRDSRGAARLAPLLFVSPSQINFEVPDGTAPGNATLEIVNAPTTMPSVAVPVRNLAPGLFTLNKTAAAYGVRLEADGGQTVLPPGSPIVLDDRPVDLVLFGTGIRYRSSLSGVKCTIGGVAVPVEYAGPGGGVPGLDQVNVRLTADLKGKANGRLVLTVDGVTANAVMVDVR